ncbi:MAG: hypothetical protein CM1200mP28_07500 [Deltaproteobacteria bacterium]|nr:MAG: hypothetical protein CM1200mP28_07500 [Deltaproteobacteria bacterium]
MIQNIGIRKHWIKKLRGPLKFAMAAECVLNTAIPFQISSISGQKIQGDVKKINPEDTIQIMDAVFSANYVKSVSIHNSRWT